MIKFFIVIVVALIAFLVFVRYLESKSVFFPQKEIEFLPDAKRYLFSEVFFQTEDGLTLNGWFFRYPSAQATLLFFHGNGGNVCHRLDKILLFRDMGLNVFIIDYRGYGKSQGRPSEQGVYQDAIAAFDYLSGRLDIHKDKIIGYGESLGGVVALELARKRPFAALIVDSSFSSVADIAKLYYPFIPAFLLRTRMDAASYSRDIKAPKLFIHSQNDDIVPFTLGKKLFDAAAEPKEFLAIQGDHNQGYVDSKDVYSEGIKKFLNVQGLLP
ncbi:MAG TPA: alpha/beta hydrolase [Candidatus Omnitrophota bacterium]|nr:alpha/beta hydrolase [Candidatus Omnitrophota bacterium]HQL40694.1 alpha/beta hydrolase [Candidatus Omnitrophota bacterium]